MAVQEAIATFSSYSPEEKTDFLARLAHALTILARDTYEVGQEGLVNPTRMRIINEKQHRVIGFLLALIRNDPKRYPDDVLMNIILEQSGDAHLQRQLQEVVTRLMAQRAAAW